MESSRNLFSFSIDQLAAAYLSETGKWCRFLSVIGFISIGFIALAGIFGASVLGSMSNVYGGGLGGSASVAIALIYLLVAVLYLYPTLALYRFSKLIRNALNTQDQHQFNEALRHLRNVFKFMGILTLIVLGIYVLIFIVALLGAGLGSMF